VDYSLKELLDIPRLRQLLESFDAIHSMPSAIIDIEGNILTATAWQEICTKFHRKNPETEKLCIESDTHIRSQLRNMGRHVVFRCPMGLVDSATPIVVDGKHLGNVFTGQLFIDPPDEARFVEQARRYGFDEKEYLAAMRKVPFFTEEHLHRNLTFIHTLAEMLAEQGLRSKRQLEAQEALRKSEESFRSVIAAIPVPLGIHDEEGRILLVNKAFTDALGYTAQDLPSLAAWWPLAYPDPVYRESVISAWRHTVEDARETGRFAPLEVEVTCKDGSTRTMLCSTAPIGNVLSGTQLAIFYDISERRSAEQERLHLERQLLHAQKLESLGVLAGGIAHDFNNILTSIIGNADLALRRVSAESPVQENLRRIEQGAVRAADLARQMLAYSGKGRFVVEPIDLNRLVEEMVGMLEVSISKGALLRYDLAKGLPSVEADATQIRQVIMNLVMNASEAIGERSGVIVISTGCLQCDERYLNSGWLSDGIAPGMYAFVEVADNGCGMDAETLSRIFDPFFTTKFTGRGLGMAAVMGIVRGHKGAIRVYSEKGKGSTFKVLLPASGKPTELFDGASHPADWSSSGRVLLVDDEETVRCVGTEMLKELGFDTVTANNGREALDIYAHSRDFRLVLLDLTMPHMDGEECYRKLRRLDPQVKVILCSGFSEQEVARKFAGKGLAGFVQKPYKFSVLRDAVRSAMGE